MYWNQAVDVFTRALEVYPGDAEVNYNLGVAQQALGKAQNAAQNFASALETDPQVCANEQSQSWLLKATWAMYPVVNATSSTR